MEGFRYFLVRFVPYNEALEQVFSYYVFPYQLSFHQSSKFLFTLKELLSDGQVVVLASTSLETFKQRSAVSDMGGGLDRKVCNIIRYSKKAVP